MSIIQLNNVPISEETTVSVVNFPPNVAIDFGSLVTLFASMTPQSSEPTAPIEGNVYLDDGTNTGSGTLGLRWYNGSAWVDFGLQSAGSLDDLSDVVITGVSDGDRVVYDATSGKWENANAIDGGSF